MDPTDLYDTAGLSPFGEDTGTVLPDVSNGSPDEQPTTPTGTGTGYYVPPAWESGLLGGLTSALNTAIAKDQQAQVVKTSQAVAATNIAVAQNTAKLANTRLLLLGGLGLAALFLMKEG